MKTLIKIIGVMVICLAMYAIPILAACCFCLDWDDALKFMLVLVGSMELAMLCVWVYTEVDE